MRRIRSGRDDPRSFGERPQRRVVRPAGFDPPGAARSEWATGRCATHVGRSALDRDELLADLLVEARDRVEQPDRVRVRRAGEQVGVVAVSTMNPAYMTLIRWVIPATTPRSWVIRMSAVRILGQVAQELEDLGLDRHVEGGRRLVRDQQLRLQGKRHRDHHPLAHPARELVGKALEARLRAWGSRPSRAARSPWCLASLETFPVGDGSSRPSAPRSSGPGSGWSSGPGRSSRYPDRGWRAARPRAAGSGPGHRTRRGRPRSGRPAWAAAG